MSCCPPAPQLVESAGADNVSGRTDETAILPGERVECYMSRAENPSGKKDDLTDYEPNRILNTSIPVKTDGSIDVKFELTSTSTVPASNVAWEYSGNPNWLTSSTTTGNNDTLKSGSIPDSDKGKKFEVQVTAKNGTEVLDTRRFAFAVETPSPSNSIQFINPLPGGRVTSLFGPRVHPVKGTNAPHKGIDISTPGAATSDVVAAADGAVVFTGNQPGGAGNYMKINHRNSAGQLLCQTVYMHLDRFYVSEGQKVAAGQKIGKEGNTGIGTAAHLHFECRIINGSTQTWVDPLPLIRGEMPAAFATTPDNQAAPGSERTVQGDATLTPADVNAKTECPPPSADYPNTPDPLTPAIPPSWEPPSGTIFQKAWYFVMKHEVGPHWSSSPEFSPGDSELDAGLFGTKLQKKKVGYINHPVDPGGETKFGVAQKTNAGKITVRDLTYPQAEQVGFNNYWKRIPGISSLEADKPRTAILLMDMIYQHGEGNVSKLLQRANIFGLGDAQSCEALKQQRDTFFKDIVASNESKRVFLNGWLRRSNEALQYALSVSLSQTS